MNYLETILNFLTRLARIIFPRKQKPSAGDCPCPSPFPSSSPDSAHSPGTDPQPAPIEPPLPPDARNGSNPNLHRSDPLALTQSDWGTSKNREADWLGLSGYSLMIIGGAGCLYKWVVG